MDGMAANYSDSMVRGHLVAVKRLERLRWRVTIDGRRLFTFCSQARARAAGFLEARRLGFIASDPHPPRLGRTARR
jgi:hypothetical protein